MSAQKVGERHPLLFYRRTMDRVWKSTLFLGIVLAVAGGWALANATTILNISSDIWLFAGAAIAFALCIFAFIARYIAYVQATANYLKVVTPFLRMKISYRRIGSVRPVLVQQLFPQGESSWAQNSFLEPFYGKTVVVLDLKGYPLNPTLLKLFLPAQMFSPRSTGLVILVPDWMKFSTELDSLQGAYRQALSQRRRGR